MDGSGLPHRRTGRPDVFPASDLALRRAVRNVHGLDRMPTERELLAMAEPWRPYRTLAAAYLFRSQFGGTAASPAVHSQRTVRADPPPRTPA